MQPKWGKREHATEKLQQENITVVSISLLGDRQHGALASSVRQRTTNGQDCRGRHYGSVIDEESRAHAQCNSNSAAIRFINHDAFGPDRRAKGRHFRGLYRARRNEHAIAGGNAELREHVRACVTRVYTLISTLCCLVVCANARYHPRSQQQ